MEGAKVRNSMTIIIIVMVAMMIAMIIVNVMMMKMMMVMTDQGGAKSAMNRRGKSKDSGRRGQGAGREDDDEGRLDHLDHHDNHDDGDGEILDMDNCL